jgi:voltage-gated potassium channel Kch
MKPQEATIDNSVDVAIGYLIIVVLLASFVSFGVIYGVTHNFYTSGYYTLSALFDATGIDMSSILSADVQQFTTAFYLVVGISAIDGIIKIMVIGFVIAAVVNFFAGVDIRSRLFGAAKGSLKNHIIVCGYSKLAERLCGELHEKKIPFIVINRSQPKVDMVRDAGWLALREDFTHDSAFKNAMIEKAKAVVFLTENDYENLLGVVTARHMNKDVMIISRGKEDNTIPKIRRAGAGICIVPEVIAGLELGDRIAAKMI